MLDAASVHVHPLQEQVKSCSTALCVVRNSTEHLYLESHLSCNVLDRLHETVSL